MNNTQTSNQYAGLSGSSTTALPYSGSISSGYTFTMPMPGYAVKAHSDAELIKELIERKLVDQTAFESLLNEQKIKNIEAEITKLTNELNSLKGKTV